MATSHIIDKKQRVVFVKATGNIEIEELLDDER